MNDQVINKRVTVAGCKPHPRNYNTHDDAQVEDLRESLRQFGQVRSIVVQATKKPSEYLIVAGHGVTEAARRDGIKTLKADVIPAAWRPARVLAYLAADNELARRGNPDEAQLAAIVAEVQQKEGDVIARLAAGEQRALDNLLRLANAENGMADAEPQIDRAEELNKKWQVRTGDLWRIGEHRLLCGDSTRREDVERVMGGKVAVLFATDPPYGVGYNDETGSGVGDTIANDENDGPKLQSFLESAFKAWLPSLDKHAAWYLWHAQMTQGFFAAAAAAAAVLIHRQIIWIKPSLIMGHGDYHWKHELCFYGWVKGFRPTFYGERNQSTVWEVGRSNDTDHPTEKPKELWEAPMMNHTKRGGICAEAFAGSGSQFVEGQNLGRVVYGMDSEPKWCAVILERMATAFPGIEIERLSEDGNGRKKQKAK